MPEPVGYPSKYDVGASIPGGAPPIPATGSAVFFGDFDGNLGDYRVQNIGGIGAHRFSFEVPADFGSLVKLCLICSPAALAAGPNKDIDLASDYGADGEPYNQHSEADVGTLYDFTGLTDKWIELDISPVFSQLAAGDRGGVFVDHKGIGGTIRYIGVHLRYVRT